MDIEQELAAESAVGHASPRDQVRRLKMEFPIPGAMLRLIKNRGEDLSRWGIVEDQEEVVIDAPAEGGGTEKRATGIMRPVFRNATLRVRELSMGEIKSLMANASSQLAGEQEQIKAALERFGTMDVTGREYDLGFILDLVGVPGHQYLVSASNHVIFAGTEMEYLTEAMESLGAGKIV